MRSRGRLRAWCSTRLRRWIDGWSRSLALAFVLLVSALPRLVVAAPAAEPVATRPVIVPGREQEVLALLRPHALGEELEPGWTLRSVGIEVGTITIRIEGPEASPAVITLDHRHHAPPGARVLEGFAIAVVERPPGSEAAVERLLAAIERNDDGAFWERDVVHAGEPREHPHSSSASGGAWREAGEAWVRDGLVFLGALGIVLLALVIHELRGAPRWTAWVLLGIVGLGAGLRLLLSPAVALAPWPYTRVPLPAKMIFHGPGLAVLHPEPVWLSEAVLGCTLVFAILAPLAVFAHARCLLDDHRAGLLAALVIAVLPLHLRFSHSDVAFVPSVTLGAIAFALAHVATRGSSKVAGWLAIAALPVPLVVLYELRPLNLVFCPLLWATAFVHQGLHADKPRIDRMRVAAAIVVIGAVTFGIGVPRLLAGFGPQVSDGLGVATLGRGLRVLVSPSLNALVSPVFSPPGLVVLVVIGVVDLWRRRRRALLWFLVAWFLGLLVAHAYVVPRSEYMQARYHLHLAAPFVLLAVCGADAGLRWLARGRGRGWSWVWIGALAYVLASPLLHLHGIRHVAFDDVHEWRFVHGLREEIPPQCTIAEYDGRSTGLRFARVGSWVEQGVPRERWRVVAVRSADDVGVLLADPPQCLYWYEGLPCFADGPQGEPKAAACRAMEEIAELEQVAVTRFTAEPYDENLAKGRRAGEEVALRLHRVQGRRRAP